MSKATGQIAQMQKLNWQLRNIERKFNLMMPLLPFWLQKRAEARFARHPAY